ncbi:MAG: response regulator [Desulfobacterales bacterium]|jgi:two-component system response regulator HydG
MNNGGKILIVDDDATHRFMLEGVLGSWGYSTDEADDGTTAVWMVQGCHYVLVLMDIRMKTLSGLDALFEIKNLDRCIPVILMTAYCNEKVVAKALLHGAVAVLNKPLHLDELKTVINRVMPRKCLEE